MIIVKQPKLIFIHNQKAAGMSVENYLLSKLKGERLLERHSYACDGLDKIGLETWNQYHTFGFVRNPWDRLVSWYVMIQETPPKSKNKLWDYVHSNSTNFEEFIINCTDSIVEDRFDYRYEKSFIKPQLEYFTDKDGKIITNFIGRFENLQLDFNNVLKSVGLSEYQLPHLNQTRAKNYREFYSLKTREIVATRFKKDIDYFGYSF